MMSGRSTGGTGSTRQAMPRSARPWRQEPATCANSSPAFLQGPQKPDRRVKKLLAPPRLLEFVPGPRDYEVLAERARIAIRRDRGRRDRLVAFGFHDEYWALETP